MPDRDDDAETHLAIGCFAALCRDRLADRLLSFSRVAPSATIGVQELALAELSAAVRDGRIALAVAPEGTQGGEGLAAMTLWREEVVVAMPAGHPLAAMTAVAPAALADQLILLSADRAEGEMQRYQLARLFACRRPPLDVRGGAGGVLTPVAAGEGLTLMLAGHGAPSGVVTRPIATAAATFAVEAWWRADDDSTALATLLRLLGG